MSTKYTPGLCADAWARGFNAKRLWSYPIAACREAYRLGKWSRRAAIAKAGGST